MSGQLHDDELRVVLDICDRLEKLRLAHDRTGRPAQRRRITEQKQRQRERLRAVVGQLLPSVIRLPPSANAGWSALDGDSLIMAAILLHRRLTSGDSVLLGRELLWHVHDSTYDVLTGLVRLLGDSPLLRSGIVVAMTESDHNREDVLHRGFSLSPGVLHDLARRLTDDDMGITVQPPVTPWLDSTEVLLDWNEVSRAYQRRAAKIFPDSVWREVHGEPLESVASLQERVAAETDRIRRRRDATEGFVNFDLPAFEREFDLDEPDMVILTTLLWEEAILGSPCQPLAELLRLVSSSNRDVLRRRRHFLPSSALIRHGIIEFDEMYQDKLSTAEVYVASWASTRLLDARQCVDRAIAADEKIEFHGYLSKLRGSSDFFDRLD